MEANDKALDHFKTKFLAHYGPAAIPWDQIIAALLSLLGGCTLMTPANIRTQINRPLVRARLMLKFLAFGVLPNSAAHAVAATVATIKVATDTEVQNYLAAAQESE